MILGNFTEKKIRNFFPEFFRHVFAFALLTFLFYTFKKLFCSEPFIILDSKVDVIDDEYIKLTFNTYVLPANLTSFHSTILMFRIRGSVKPVIGFGLTVIPIIN